jgi:hypothetical protein
MLLVLAMTSQIVQVLVLFSALELAVGFRLNRRNSATRLMNTTADQTSLKAICDEEIVQETCAQVEGPVHDFFQAMISASDETMQRLWRALRLEREATCEDVCSSVADRLGNLLPPFSDVGCYTDATGVRCDLDLSEQTLHDAAHIDGDLPSAHHSQYAIAAHHPAAASLEVEYGTDEAVAQVANLFRIYPAPSFEISAPEGMDSSLTEGASGWQSGVQKNNQQAQAYMATAIRKFKAKQTKTPMTKWFGKNAFTRSRATVQNVLNSAAKVLRSVDFIYPGSICRSRFSGAYAYVQPGQKKGSKFVINLCKPFMSMPTKARISGLVHEATHHPNARTTDWKYGRSGCAQLAKSKPSQALNNADNFRFYIEDITR